jgi:hypothetical protein
VVGLVSGLRGDKCEVGPRGPRGGPLSFHSSGTP